MRALLGLFIGLLAVATASFAANGNAAVWYEGRLIGK
jgi:hypothetical protein